jgi:hypothetical protein
MFGNKLLTITILEKTLLVLVFNTTKVRDAFIPPKPFNSWVLNEDTCQWEAPVAKPDDDQDYKWNETIKNWELI